MKTVSLLLAAIILGACSAKEEPKTVPPPVRAQAVADREVTGQVFITQKNGQSVKLGNIEVVAVEFAIAKARLDRARSNSFELLKPVEARATAAEAKDSQARQAADDAEKALANARVNTATLPFMRQVDILAPFQERDAKARSVYITALGEAIKVQEETAKQRRKLTPGAIAFSELWPSQLASAMTDADGNFAIRLPSRETVLVAHSSRMLLDTVEDYHWVITVPTNHSGKLLLNNANLLSQ